MPWLLRIIARSVIEREPDRERGASTLLALDADRSSMLLHDLLTSLSVRDGRVGPQQTAQPYGHVAGLGQHLADQPPSPGSSSTSSS
jgi:hypothetical protein